MRSTKPASTRRWTCLDTVPFSWPERGGKADDADRALGDAGEQVHAQRRQAAHGVGSSRFGQCLAMKSRSASPSAASNLSPTAPIRSLISSTSADFVFTETILPSGEARCILFL